MDWLALLALALIAGSGWCAAAETSLLRVSRAGAKELARSPGGVASPLQAVLAEVPRYLAVLALARYAAEATATVLTTVVALHVIGPGWRAFAAAAAAVTAAIYLATGIIPRYADRRPPSWPGPAAVAVTAGPRRSHRRTCAAWSTCWNSARSSSRPSGR
jgi:CBS domain containing-hemolysin-like protein